MPGNAARALALLVAALCAPAAVAQTVETAEDWIRITMPDGSVRTGPDLTGAVLTVADDAGAQAEIRIAGAVADHTDPERWLYTLERRSADGKWRNACAPGPDGLRAGFPVAVTLTDTGTAAIRPGSLMVSCTSGAVAKCIRMGYAPWETTPSGASLLGYLQACMRMVRADYCGTGMPNTRDGTLINVFDRLGIQTRDLDDRLEAEAAWGPDGAVCVRRTRLSDVARLEDLHRQCPARMAGRTGPEACAPHVMHAMETALIWNESIPTD